MTNTIVPLRVVQYGLGPIGSAIARHIVERPGLDLVGAVDIARGLVGREVGDVLGLDGPLGFAVSSSLADCLARAAADVATHATSSYMDMFKDQIIEILESGLDLVSTAEELSFPWADHPSDAEEIDAVAKRAGKTALATGVNPGFLLDALPLGLTAICQRVDHISVTRTIDASTRRGPFQAKIGAGMTVDEFRARMASGRMGHVGLRESMGMVFDTLGRSLTRVESQVEPLVVEHEIRTEHSHVLPGQVMGLRQVARGFEGERCLVSFTFVAALEVEDEADIIGISGVPGLQAVFRGTNGDIATVAIIVNAIRRVVAAPPGLLCMRDLPMVTHW